MCPYCPQTSNQFSTFLVFFKNHPTPKIQELLSTYLEDNCVDVCCWELLMFFSKIDYINMTPWKLKQQTHIQTTKIYGLMRLSVAAHSLKKNLPWRRLCRCLLLRAAHVFPQIAQEATSTIGCGEVWSCVVWVVHDSNLKSKMKGTGLTDTTYISTYFVRKGVLLHPGRKP